MERRELGPREFARVTAGRGAVATGRVREASPVLADGVERFIFADVFSHSGLAARDRELITCAVLAAIGGADNQLAVHVPAALECGVDPDELIQLCEQITPYAGFPRALNALRAVRAVLEERGLPLPLATREVNLGDTWTLVTDVGEGDEGYFFLHTAVLDRQMWRDVIRALPPGTRCVAPDLRGCGTAAAAPRPRDLDHLVADLRCVADATGLQRIRLVSMGSASVLAVAAQRALGERVVSIACALGTDPPSPPDQAVPSYAMMAEWLSPEALAANGWMVRYGRDRIDRVDIEGFRGLVAALSGHEWATDPTFDYIPGEQDAELARALEVQAGR